MSFTIPWWVWAVLAIVIGFAELHMPGGYLIWIALGAAITALLDAMLGLSLTAQLVTFIVASAVSCVGGSFVYRRLNQRASKGDTLNQRDQRMIGTQGIVCETFVNGQGKVRIGDTVWLAEGPPLDEGTPVTVKAVRGTWVIVEPAARV